jgi:hypothetical protein
LQIIKNPEEGVSSAVLAKIAAEVEYDEQRKNDVDEKLKY